MVPPIWNLTEIYCLSRVVKLLWEKLQIEKREDDRKLWRRKSKEMDVKEMHLEFQYMLLNRYEGKTKEKEHRPEFGGLISFSQTGTPQR